MRAFSENGLMFRQSEWKSPFKVKVKWEIYKEECQYPKYQNQLLTLSLTLSIYSCITSCSWDGTLSPFLIKEILKLQQYVHSLFSIDFQRCKEPAPIRTMTPCMCIN